MAQDFAPQPVSPAPAPRNTNTTLIIIIVVVVVLLCCCCLTLVLGWQFGDQILQQLGLASSVAPSGLLLI